MEEINNNNNKNREREHNRTSINLSLSKTKAGAHNLNVGYHLSRLVWDHPDLLLFYLLIINSIFFNL